MALLQQILYKVNILSVVGSTVTEVNDLQIDSRKVNAGSCFIAIKGTLSDGHDFIDTAISNGAVSVVCEKLPSILNDNVQYTVVENSAIAAGISA